MDKRKIVISSPGYPRIGERGEAVEAIKAFRAGAIGEREMTERMKKLRLEQLMRQQKAGVDWIPVGDFALYDHVLEHSIAFGIVPERFAEAAAQGSSALACAMAEGTAQAAACRTESWFDTPYRFFVPEWTMNMTPRLVRNPWAEAFREARPLLQTLPKPVMVGPYTFVRLADGLLPEDRAAALDALTPAYAQALAELQDAGAVWVQIDEPAISRTVPQEDWPLIERVYQTLHDAAPGLRILLQISYGVPEPEDFVRLTALPAAGFGLDFTADGGRMLEIAAKCGFPADRVLGVGIVDGLSVWRTDLTAACTLLENLRRLFPRTPLALQPSCNLLHVPISLRHERALHGLPRLALAFADEKLGELRVLRTALTDGRDAVRLDLMDSDVLQDMLLSCAPGAWPSGRLPVEHAWVQTCGVECVRPAVAFGKPKSGRMPTRTA